MKIRIKAVLSLLAILYANILFAQINLLKNPFLREYTDWMPYPKNRPNPHQIAEMQVEKNWKPSNSSCSVGLCYKRANGEIEWVQPRGNEKKIFRLEFSKKGTAIIQGELAHPLVKGKNYLVSCYMLQDTSIHLYSSAIKKKPMKPLLISNYYLNNFGISFSPVSNPLVFEWCYEYELDTAFYDLPHIILRSPKPAKPAQKMQWIKIQNVYTARGDETYMVMGFMGKKEEYASAIRAIKDSMVNAYIDSISVIELPQNFKIKEEIASPATFAIKPLYFDTGKTNLNPDGSKTLDAIINAMLADNSLKIRIKGYTDNEGDDRLNYSLSIDRALAVYNYLSGRGIDKRRIVYKGMGISIENSTDKEKRRVDVDFFTNRPAK